MTANTGTAFPTVLLWLASTGTASTRVRSSSRCILKADAHTRAASSPQALRIPIPKVSYRQPKRGRCVRVPSTPHAVRHELPQVRCAHVHFRRPRSSSHVNRPSQRNVFDSAAVYTCQSRAARGATPALKSSRRHAQESPQPQSPDLWSLPHPRLRIPFSYRPRLHLRLSLAPSRHALEDQHEQCPVARQA